MLILAIVKYLFFRVWEWILCCSIEVRYKAYIHLHITYVYSTTGFLSCNEVRRHAPVGNRTVYACVWRRLRVHELHQIDFSCLSCGDCYHSLITIRGLIETVQPPPPFSKSRAAVTVNHLLILSHRNPLYLLF